MSFSVSIFCPMIFSPLLCGWVLCAEVYERFLLLVFVSALALVADCFVVFCYGCVVCCVAFGELFVAFPEQFQLFLWDFLVFFGG